MRPYGKIETLFDRDKETFRVIDGAYRRPEFGIINSWVVTEKIDGTNIRLHWNRSSFEPTVITSSIGGRTDRAQLSTDLLGVLTDVTTSIDSEVQKIMDEHELSSYTLYGEGYGPGLQKCGGRYRSTKGFILFDVLAGDNHWLSPAQAVETAQRLGLTHVPVLGEDWPTDEIVRLVRGGYASDAAESYDPDFKAEGIIAKPTVPLYNQRGDRVMFKLKHVDYVGGKF